MYLVSELGYVTSLSLLKPSSISVISLVMFFNVYVKLPKVSEIAWYICEAVFLFLRTS